jgi:hypothetical protein
MTDRLATLIKRVAELLLGVCHCVRSASRRTTALKNCIFGGFTPSVTGRHWHSNVRGWPIPVVILQKVISSSFLHIVDNNPVLI